jgi:hypothetical protein
VRRGTLKWQLDLAQTLSFEDQHVMTRTADIRRQLDELGALVDQGRTARATPEMVESVYTRTAEVEISAKTFSMTRSMSTSRASPTWCRHSGIRRSDCS